MLNEQCVVAPDRIVRMELWDYDRQSAALSRTSTYVDFEPEAWERICEYASKHGVSPAQAIFDLVVGHTWYSKGGG